MFGIHPYFPQVQQVVLLLNRVSKELTKSFKGRVSTADLTADRLLWEIFNKIFTIIVSCENALRTKDSLVVHLMARYTYELLIVFAYIFCDESKRQKSVDDFLKFNQFTSQERKWNDRDFSKMIDEIPDKERFARHKQHYRALSNFAHPTMDSLMLNRRGDKAEFLQNLDTVLLTIGTIIELINIAFEKNLFFRGGPSEQKLYTDIATEAHSLMARDLSELTQRLSEQRKSAR